MSQYVAVLRLSHRHQGKSPLVRLCAALSRLPGVGSVQPDWGVGGGGSGGGEALVVMFDRARVSLGEIVRAIEDEGTSVSGVAQSRAKAVEPGHLATA
jgi:hypothetical protein